MSDAGHSNFKMDTEGWSEKVPVETDPIIHAIEALRRGLADYRANAPDDDVGARRYADVSYRPALEIVKKWSCPARSAEGAIAALRMARDAGEDGDFEIVTPMIGAALAYFEAIA